MFHNVNQISFIMFDTNIFIVNKCCAKSVQPMLLRSHTNQLKFVKIKFHFSVDLVLQPFELHSCLSLLTHYQFQSVLIPLELLKHKSVQRCTKW